MRQPADDVPGLMYHGCECWDYNVTCCYGAGLQRLVCHIQRATRLEGRVEGEADLSRYMWLNTRQALILTANCTLQPPGVP